jgi:hypothetical protein
MPEPLQVDPDQMTADSNQFTDLADSAHSAGSGLMNGVGMVGNFAGTDKFGNLFNTSFTPAVTGLGNSLISLGGAFTATAQGLVSSAGKYVESNQAAEDSVPAPIDSPAPAPAPASAPRRS